MSSKPRRFVVGKPSISKDPAVKRFSLLAQSYCDLIEGGTTSCKQLLRKCAEMLPELLAAAIGLPPGRENKRIGRELGFVMQANGWAYRLSEAGRCKAAQSQYRHSYVPTKQFFSVSRRLAKILGAHNLYREIFDPYEDKDPIEAALSNDLAEIWHDLKPSLLLFELPEEAAKRHAVYMWALMVRVHWARSHCMDAMKAIIHALSDVDDYWDVPELDKKHQQRLRKRRNRPT